VSERAHRPVKIVQLSLFLALALSLRGSPIVRLGNATTKLRRSNFTEKYYGGWSAPVVPPELATLMVMFCVYRYII
jgi:hypothetical protein